jgi:hypothetical protein
MGLLQKLFNLGKPDKSKETTVQAPPASNPSAPAQSYSVPAAPQTPDIPPERLGLDGEYDDSGLAKRVALALDENSADFERLWIAQTGSTVVFKGEIPSQADLDRVVGIARGVYGAKDVKTTEVKVG